MDIPHPGMISNPGPHFDHPDWVRGGDICYDPILIRAKNFPYPDHIYTSWPKKLLPFPPVTWGSTITDT